MTAWTVATLIKIDITYVVWNSTSAHFPWNSIFYFIKMFSYLEMVVVSDSLQHHYKTLWEPLITNISYHPGPGHEVWVSRISPKENPVYFKTYVIQNIRYCYKWIMIQMTNTGLCTGKINLTTADVTETKFGVQRTKSWKLFQDRWRSFISIREYVSEFILNWKEAGTSSLNQALDVP